MAGDDVDEQLLSPPDTEEGAHERVHPLGRASAQASASVGVCRCFPVSEAISNRRGSCKSYLQSYCFLLQIPPPKLK